MINRQRIEMLEAWAKHDVEILRSFKNTVERFGGDFEMSRVLDVGCGSNAPISLMLHSGGTKVTGIDQHIGYRWGLGFKLDRYFRYIKEAGLFKTLRKVAGEIVYDRHYYRIMQNECGYPLTEDALDLRTQKIEELPFADSCFEIVHSNATWEHIADVNLANREITRVLVPGGIAYIEIHLFPSLSGGHDLEWIVPGKEDLDVPYPWRHLRDSSWEEPVYLNRLRERNYRESFEEISNLEVLSWQTEYTEGEQLLTNELLRELSDYTRDDLTKRSIIVIVRKTSE